MRLRLCVHARASTARRGRAERGQQAATWNL